MFSVVFEKIAEKFIEKLKDKILLKRILNKIKQLKDNPFPLEAVRVKEYKDDKVFRIRIGKCRVLYYVNHKKSLIVIIKIEKREKVY